MLLRLLRCRFIFKLYVLVIIILIFAISGYLFPQFKLYPIAPVTVSPSAQLRTFRHLSKSITVVFRQFANFENDVADSVQSFIAAFTNMPVLVVSKSPPYPPFPFTVTNETLRNVKVMSLDLRLGASPEELNPLTFITTEYVLFVPGSSRASRRVLQQAIAAVALSPHSVVMAVGNHHLNCHHVKWNYSEWTLQYSKDPVGKLCDAVLGPHALLMRTALLKALPQPFMMPFPESLYLQAIVRNAKVQILDGKLAAGRDVMKTPAAKQRVGRHIRDHRIALYKKLGVKIVVRDDGKVISFGCKKETPRCFPLVQGTPSYILAGRNTPPCCRRNLRTTVNHVLQTLAAAGARCWLETTSLLGAVVRSELLLWAEYAEVGVHADDEDRVAKLAELAQADSDGFVWERATKGRYYTVAFSRTNRIYTLVLPFAPRNGTMYPVDWVLAHQREFPERHLHPLAQISFAGGSAPAPNDARAFLDLKLGGNAVERCQQSGARMMYP